MRKIKEPTDFPVRFFFCEKSGLLIKKETKVVKSNKYKEKKLVKHVN